MVADKIDMSLDDIIASNRRGRGGGRGRGGRGGGARNGRGRGGGRGASRGRNNSTTRNGGGPIRRGASQNRSAPYSRPRDLPDKWEHDKYDGPARNGATGRRSEGVFTGAGAHLQIANLDFGVTESDIKELFSEFGKLKKAIINYDSSGRSHGTADVIFERKADASKAVRTYNGVPLDGRPMKIEIVASEVLLEQNTTSPRRRLSGGNRGNNRGAGQTRGRSNSRGGRGSRGRGGRGRRDQREPVSKDDLDRELDSYVVKGSN